jgi:hypothetical protein
MMNQVTNLIVKNQQLVGNIHKTNNPFNHAYIVSVGDNAYGHNTYDAAIRCAIRNMPKGASLIKE